MASLNLDPLSYLSTPRVGTRRIRAAGIHFLISAFVASCVAAVIFRVWYPYPFNHIAGVFSLLLLLISVDITLGPILTAIAASPKKPLRELKNDIIIIAILQVAAFIYGIYAISLARPVHVVFEVDHFRVISAANIDPALLRDAPDDFKQLPLTGPTLIAAAKPLSADEQFKAIELGFAGFDISLIPRNWRSYDSQSGSAWNAGQPLEKALNQYPNESRLVERLVRESGRPIDDLRFLPVIGRNGNWIAVIKQPNSQVVGYLPLNGYF